MTYCPMADAELEIVERRCKTCPIGEAKGACENIIIPQGRNFPLLSNASTSQGMELVDKALDYAAMAHKGTMRKASRTPYIVHPVEVTHYVKEILDELKIEKPMYYNIMAAAALHDVVEDTKYTADDIREAFGDDITALVASETEDKMRHLPSSQTWHIRKQTFLDHLSEASLGAQIIALADKTANALDLAEEKAKEGERMWDKFNEKNPDEHQWYFKSIASILESSLGQTTVYRRYIDTLKKIFN